MSVEQYQQQLQSVYNGSQDLDVQTSAQQANQYTEMGEVGFGVGRTYSGSGTIMLLDNFSVVPEPAALLPLLLCGLRLKCFRC